MIVAIYPTRAPISKLLISECVAPSNTKISAQITKNIIAKNPINKEKEMVFLKHTSFIGFFFIRRNTFRS